MQLSGKRVAIVGLGASGVAAARLCLLRGAEVVGIDEAPADKLSVDARSLVGGGVKLRHGPLERDWFDDVDVVVVSPGMPPRAALADAEARGSEVISELELASRFLEAPLVLVGGTNGKSTVTAWSHAILEASGKRAFIGGNFGRPLSDAVGEDFDVLVVEISSFQAERVPSLRAKVHALLNISEDHLDRYADFRAYADAKGNPFVNMTSDDVAVVPHADAACAAQVARGAARTVSFGLAGGDVSLEGDEIVDRVRGARYSKTLVRLRGLHNLENACATVAVVGALGVSGAVVERGLSEFAGLEHRSVLVAEIDGVRFYDDSKATNVGAAVAALRGLEEPRAVLIAGGRDKQGAYEPLVEALRARGRALVVLGEAADRIADAARDVLPIERAQSMADAVARAADLARAGDAVLLSPACSSYDMYPSYKARGADFASEVRRRVGGAA